MVAEVVEQSPVIAEAMLQPRAVVGAELLDSLFRRAASGHGLNRTAAVSGRARAFRFGADGAASMRGYYAELRSCDTRWKDRSRR